MDEIVKKTMEILKQIEFETFVVGASNKDPTLKEEIKRKLEGEIEKEIRASKDNSNPDVQVIIGEKGHVKTLIAPLFIFGRYQKLERGIPQTKWPCRDCKGNGCAKCDYTGLMYKDSVEQIIARVIMEQTKGNAHSFHGAGREDRDALMLGNGRPFILEISSPKKRKIDLEKAAEKINKQGRINVTEVRMASRYEIGPLKASKAEKTYSVIVKAEKPISKEDLEKLQAIKGEIKQKTPLRVMHRRADLERTRHLLGIETEYIDETHFKAILKTDAGLYVKELISGDTGRTKPNMSETLENQLACEELDVINVDFKG